MVSVKVVHFILFCENVIFFRVLVSVATFCFVVIDLVFTPLLFLVMSVGYLMAFLVSPSVFFNDFQLSDCSSDISVLLHSFSYSFCLCLFIIYFFIQFGRCTYSVLYIFIPVFFHKSLIIFLSLIISHLPYFFVKAYIFGFQFYFFYIVFYGFVYYFCYINYVFINFFFGWMQVDFYTSQVVCQFSVDGFPIGFVVV